MDRAARPAFPTRAQAASLARMACSSRPSHDPEILLPCGVHGAGGFAF